MARKDKRNNREKITRPEDENVKRDKLTRRVLRLLKMPEPRVSSVREEEDELTSVPRGGLDVGR